ncbi:transposase [Pleurocapsa sp. CCALA 161]|uniref:RNA-guided endonuclease InsQ/TnpB family protein n=1 Tax=Pleurocapsa sp. CCALA 161 TaxID=2107688 RepID=UPI000D06882D|nr:RNA-guided endonuclease TnpB family protein [Pleurocapsa sp. CCALA 161]PSB11759.1 transposase [Pleurocapsa sp. CCALA 161]
MMINMLRQAQKVRIYPTDEQKQQLAGAMGCSRWWWNFALNKSIETYKETGKGLSRAGLNALLPNLKEEHEWLRTEVYSQSLQQTSLNLSRAFINFFEKRARFPRYKSKHGKQSVGFPQSVKITGDGIKLPKIGLVKAVFDRRYFGTIKTVTITKDSSDRYFASILYEIEACFVSGNGDKIIGLDLGIKDFCIAHDGTKTSKYANPRHFKKYERNLARKQQKLFRKQKGSKTRQKAKKLVAKVHVRISNARQDFLHKLSRKLTNESKVVVVENLFLNGSLMGETPKTAPVRNVKGMVRNHKLAKLISDVGWGMFVNFLSYKLERENKRLVEIDRWFPSSHICPDCLTQTPKIDLSIREWTCLNTTCGKTHDRDEAASRNIRAEGIRIIKADGTAVSASGGSVRPDRGRKTKVRQHPAKLETQSSPLGRAE